MNARLHADDERVMRLAEHHRGRRIAEEVDPVPEVQYLVEFCRASKRGLMGLHGVTTSEEEEQIELEKGDLLPIILSALIVFGPILLVFIAILLFIFWSF